MANKNRMEFTITEFPNELQFNSTDAPTASKNRGRRGTSFPKRRRLLTEGIVAVDSNIWFVDDTAEFPEGLEENIPPSKRASKSKLSNSNDESALDKTVVEEEDLFSSDLDVGNGDLDLEESSYSRFTLGVPSTSTFIREPSDSPEPEPHPMEDTLHENTPTATPRRILRSRNPPTKTTTTAAQPTKEAESEDSDNTSNEESCDEKEPPNPRPDTQPKEGFGCPLCSKYFMSKKTRNLHQYSQHMTQEELKENSIPHWKCCDKVFVKKQSYDIHLQTHKGVKGRKAHKCPECPQKFIQKGNLDRHVKTVHLKQKDFNCSECDCKFGRKGHLTEHFDSIHLGIKYECPNCKRKFGFKCDLRKHGKSCRK